MIPIRFLECVEFSSYCFLSYFRSVMCTIINALSLALMDAGVAMVDMISACSVGLVKNEFCLDVTQLEQNAGGAYMPIVIKARSDEIVFMQLDSRLSLDNLQVQAREGLYRGGHSERKVVKSLKSKLRTFSYVYTGSF